MAGGISLDLGSFIRGPQLKREKEAQELEEQKQKRREKYASLVKDFPELARTAAEFNDGMEHYVETGYLPTERMEEVRTDAPGGVQEVPGPGGVPIRVFPETSVEDRAMPISLAKPAQPQGQAIFYDVGQDGSTRVVNAVPRNPHDRHYRVRPAPPPKPTKAPATPKPSAADMKAKAAVEGVVAALKNGFYDAGGFMRDIETRRDAIGVAVAAGLDPEKYPEIQAALAKYAEAPAAPPQKPGLISRLADKLGGGGAPAAPPANSQIEAAKKTLEENGYPVTEANINALIARGARGGP